MKRLAYTITLSAFSDIRAIIFECDRSSSRWYFDAYRLMEVTKINPSKRFFCKIALQARNIVTSFLHIKLDICARACVYVGMCLCACVYICANVCLCLYVCVSVCLLCQFVSLIVSFQEEIKLTSWNVVRTTCTVTTYPIAIITCDSLVLKEVIDFF